ncbi:MAG: ankyrin repeat domain-containing protein [Bacteroides sp.]|nr:ankyrin repeat domain-containing protein [Prevotella sp.]MCM1408297.1 ankyrin repeat domain-containing protein [Treponema brennaborense]MCM1470471.1 ankyrin repeat domain-containing protein [Bacteroides sp.]
MNWLVIYKTEDLPRMETVRKMFDELETDYELFEFSAELEQWNFAAEKSETLNCLCKSADEDTHCIVINIAGFAASPAMAYLLGKLSGKKTPVFATMPSDAERENCMLANCHFFADERQLLSHIKDNFDQFISDEIKRTAKQKLFDTGVPFTADSFAHLVAANNKKSCRLFFDGGFDVNSRDSDGTPMLNIAVRCENIEFVEWFLELGADIDAVSEDRGYSAVMDAVWKNKQKIVELLLQHNPRLDFISRDGQPILVLASNNAAVSAMLAEHGADPYIKDKMGMSAYDYAVLFSNKPLVDVFNGLKK